MIAQKTEEGGAKVMRRGAAENVLMRLKTVTWKVRAQRWCSVKMIFILIHLYRISLSVTEVKCI